MSRKSGTDDTSVARLPMSDERLSSLRTSAKIKLFTPCYAQGTTAQMLAAYVLELINEVERLREGNTLLIKRLGIPGIAHLDDD